MSQDAIVRANPQDKANPRSAGAEMESSEPKGQELVYAARIGLDRTQMRVEENMVNLSPGMAATIEIKTGSRKIIDYLLSPLVNTATTPCANDKPALPSGRPQDKEPPVTPASHASAPVSP